MKIIYLLTTLNQNKSIKMHRLCTVQLSLILDFSLLIFGTINHLRSSHDALLIKEHDVTSEPFLAESHGIWSHGNDGICWQNECVASWLLVQFDLGSDHAVDVNKVGLATRHHHTLCQRIVCKSRIALILSFSTQRSCKVIESCS